MIVRVEIHPPLIMKPMWTPHHELEQLYLKEPMSFDIVAEGEIPISESVKVQTLQVRWKLWAEVRWQCMKKGEKLRFSDAEEGRWILLQYWRPVLPYQTDPANQIRTHFSAYEYDHKTYK